MTKKLDTIHIHGLNLIIIFTLAILILIDKRDVLMPSISAVTIKDPKYNSNYITLKNDTDESRAGLNIKINVDAKKLENKIVGISAIIYDPTDNVAIWSQASTRASSLASLTKVMTAYVYKKHCDKELHFADLIWSPNDAMQYMLIESSNEMANALSKQCVSTDDFVSMMNKEAEDLKLNLKYTNPSGLDSPGTIGGRGDAMSIAQFLYIVSSKYPDIFDATTHDYSKVEATDSSGKVYINAINTNKHIGTIGGARMSKTGLTDYAGGNLGIVYDVYLGRPLVMIVLGSTKEGRFKDIEIMRDSITIKH